MSPSLQVALLVPVAYLLGSVPFGLIVGKSRGVDPRSSGSGNIGATNVGRLLGRKFFALVFTLDLLKGLLPMLAAAYVLREVEPDRRTYVLWLLVGVAAIAGHMFSVFLGFKGGKGVATSTGVLLGLWPYYTIPGLIGAACGSSRSSPGGTSASRRSSARVRSPSHTSRSACSADGTCSARNYRCSSSPS